MKLLVILPFIFSTHLSHAWDLHFLGGISSIYTEKLPEKMGQINPEFVQNHKLEKNTIELQCFNNAKNKIYIGLAQFMLIKAPLKRVTEILESFEKYPLWFEGLVKNKAQPQKVLGEYLVESEQVVPIPFFSNIKTSMIYSIQKLEKNVLIRYQLKSSNNLMYYDGFIELQELSSGEVAFVEYDYILADWGMAKLMGPENIWTESLRGIVQTDLAIKLKAEKSDLADQDVREKSKSLANNISLSDCIKNRAANTK